MRHHRILVVEDFEPFMQLVCTTLRTRVEFRVAQAWDGEEALQKVKSLQPDLIVLDIGLPKLNGIEVAKQVGKSSVAKILFFSQESSPEIVEETLKLGARGYVQKRLAGSDLLPAIDAVLKGELFVSRGLLDASIERGFRELSKPKYPWQQTVMDAFQSPPDSLAAKINVAERTLAAYLKDANQIDVEERLALKDALLSLASLVAATRPQPALRDEEKSA